MSTSFFFNFLALIFICAQTIACSHAQIENSTTTIDTAKIFGAWKLVKQTKNNVFRFEPVTDIDNSEIDIIFNENGSIIQGRKSAFWGIPQAIGGNWHVNDKLQLQLQYSNGLTKKINDLFSIESVTDGVLEIKLLDRKESAVPCG